MPNEITPASPPSPSAPVSPSASPSWVASTIAAAPVVAAIWVVGRPIGQALPGLIELAGKGEWKPLAMALVALGLLVAPVPTLRLLSRLLPPRKE